MWDEACTAVCRRHDDVVAVFESPVGRLALLLRQPLVTSADGPINEPLDITVGAPVRVVFTKVSDDVSLPRWVPA